MTPSPFYSTACRQVMIASVILCWLAEDARVARADDGRAERERVVASTKRGLDWLMSRQGSDGGWHSETYGALRGGAAVTALSLYAAAHTPVPIRENATADLQRGLEFLLPGLEKKGCVACPDGTLDYPTYSSALTLTALKQLKLTVSERHRQALVDYLVAAQLTEQKGFSSKSPHYGGWDLIGASGARGVTSGTNVSVTYFAVSALAGEPGVPKALFHRVTRWSEACQNFPTDGGFYFHPEPMNLGNKAQWRDRQFKQARSYGTTTCDGIGCLLASGTDPGDVRVVAAVKWLEKHRKVDYVAGFENANDAIGFKESMRFYYFQGLARTSRLLPKPIAKQRRLDLIRVLLKLQREDGSWQNDAVRMREDDPLIGTCFALIALGHLRN